MKKTLLYLFVVGAMIPAFGLFTPVTSNAEVNVSINIPLPQLVFPAPPGLIVVPGSTYVYYSPDVEVDIFFYRGYWYRPYRGGWYIANGYNGPWRAVGPRRLPRAVIDVPPAYRHNVQRHERVPYPVVKRNWRGWESKRHWDKYERRERHDRDEHRGWEHDRGRGHGRGDNRRD